MLLSHPYALFWLLLTLPLIALFLLKVRPRLQAVSTVTFWQQVIPESRPRRWWQRLRHPLSLLLQILLLLLLALALAEPRWRKPLPQRRLLVILDNSASMQATDVAPSRLAAAKQQVMRLIDDLGPEDQMALLSAGTTAKLRCGLTSHKRTLRRALAEVAATDGPGQLGQAVRLAQRLPDGDAQPQLIVVTDPAGRLDAESAADTANTQWILCGQRADNLAITQFQVRRQTLDPTGYECLFEVTSFAAGPQHCRLRIELDGELQDVIPLELAPQQRHQQVLSYVSASGGALAAQLEVDDALAADNRAVAWITPRSPRRITLVTAGNRYLEKVLMAVPLVELQVTPTVPTTPDDSHTLIIDGLPVDPLPAGRSLVVQPVQSNATWQLGRVTLDSVIGASSKRSPLLSHLHLEELLARGTRELRLPENADVLAETLDNVPVYAVVPHERGETLLLNLDLRSGDFAWRTAFPLLMSNAVNWLVGQAADYQAAYPAGQVVQLEPSIEPQAAPHLALSRGEPKSSSSSRDWQAIAPDGRVRRLAQDGASIPLGPLDQTGLWRVSPALAPTDASSGESTPVLHVACNMVNSLESDLRAESTDDTAIASLGRVGQPPWFYLVALALFLLALEWWLYQRRWIG